MFKKVLSVIQTYLSLDLNFFVKNSSLVLMGQIIEAVMAFLLTVVLSNFASKENFGTYSFILVLISIFSLTSLPGTVTSLALSISDAKKINLNKIFLNNFKYSLFGAFLLTVSGYYFFLTDNNIEMFISLVVASIFFPFLFSFSNINGAYFLGKKKFKENTLFAIINSVLVTSAVCFAVVFTDNVFYFLLAYLLGTSIPHLLIYFYICSKYPKLTGDEKETVEYAKFLTKMNFLSMIATQIDQLVLGFLVSKQSVADYRIISALTNTSKNLEKSLNTIIFSKLTEFNEKEINRQKKKRLFTLFGIGLLITLFLLIIQPFFIKLFFGEKFENTIFLAEIMITTLIFLPIEIYFSQFFNAFKKNQQIKMNTVVLPTVKVILTFGCYFIWGFNGIIFSNVLARLFNVMYYLKINGQA